MAKNKVKKKIKSRLNIPLVCLFLTDFTHLSSLLRVNLSKRIFLFK